jgi:hypothetical protein
MFWSQDRHVQPNDLGRHGASVSGRPAGRAGVSRVGRCRAVLVSAGLQAEGAADLVPAMPGLAGLTDVIPGGAPGGGFEVACGAGAGKWLDVPHGRFPLVCNGEAPRCQICRYSGRLCVVAPNPASVEAQTPDVGPERGAAVMGGGRR